MASKNRAYIVRNATDGGAYPYAVSLETVDEYKVEAGEVLVEVVASALNHRDNWITQGAYPGIKEGVILGSDCVGVVVSDDPEWKGKRVILDPTIGWPTGKASSPPGKILILGMPKHGSFASHIAIPKSNLRPAPEFLTDAQAAALPLAGVTAYRAVVTKGLVKKDSVVLVTGIGGGVAVLAVQMAVALGAKVYVTSSSDEKIARAQRELGAIGGVNYTDDKWPAKLLKLTNNQRFDAVIDGAGDIASCMKIMAGGGIIVSYGSTANPNANFMLPPFFLNQIEIRGTAMGSPEDFDGLLALVNSKRIAPIVDEVFPFEQFPVALDKMRKGGQFGKLVLNHYKKAKL